MLGYYLYVRSLEVLGMSVSAIFIILIPVSRVCIWQWGSVKPDEAPLAQGVKILYFKRGCSKTAAFGKAALP
jgi:hypothetical protein